jgi:hypothetical protein
MKKHIKLSIVIFLIMNAMILFSGCNEKQARIAYTGIIDDALLTQRTGTGSSPILYVSLNNGSISFWFYSSGSGMNVSDSGENIMPIEQLYINLKHNIGHKVRIVSEDHFIKFFELLD